MYEFIIKLQGKEYSSILQVRSMEDQFYEELVHVTENKVERCMGNGTRYPKLKNKTKQNNIFTARFLTALIYEPASERCVMQCYPNLLNPRIIRALGFK